MKRPDLILYNGTVRTLDPAHPLASAVTVADGRVIEVGDDDLLAYRAADGTRTVDLGGRAVYPGFTDSHVHWNGTAQYMHAVKLDGATSKAEALARVAERARSTPPGEWITGYGWQQADWRDDARFPTAADLDAVAPDHPIMLKARSGHASWVNSLALRLCRIDASTPDPDYGEVVRDESGAPAGVLLMPWA
jgi:predicted amidohydrolase YtcJ